MTISDYLESVKDRKLPSTEPLLIRKVESLSLLLLEHPELSLQQQKNFYK